MGRDEIREVVEALRPDRIGHGILTAEDQLELLRRIGALEDQLAQANRRGRDQASSTVAEYRF